MKNPTTGVKRPIKNATSVSYLERSNNLYTGKFSLPADDNDVSKLKQFSFVEIYDGDERIEIFVIVKSTESYGNQVPMVNYELLDALFLLNMSVIEFLQLVNPTTREALEAVLDCQYVPYWTLGDCEFSRGFSYSWENENGLLDPLMSVVGDTGESYIIERDTTQFPFVIHFRRPPSQVSARVIQGYNMDGFTIEQEGKNLVNWILPKGNAEGINAVDIRKVNGGVPYLMDQQSMDEYFPAMTIWKDERYEIEQNLKDAAQSRLNAWKEPKIEWNVDAIDLSKVMRKPENLAINRNREIKANQLKVNSLIIVDTKKHGKVTLRVLQRGKSDIAGRPGELSLQITNEDVNPFSYDDKRQQEISKMTSNGAQNIIPYIFDREADSDTPVEFRFTVSNEVVNVNSCLLWINSTRFRATSKGNESIPQQVSSSTSSAGGASVQSATSSSGGASVQSATSQASGQSTQTSSANGSHRHRMFLTNGSMGPFPTKDAWYKAEGSGYVEMTVHQDAGDLYTEEAADNHTHSVTTPAHTHNVSINIPAHTHNVSINIPNHTHEVSITIPGHTHEIVYGIFEYSSLPDKLDIWIDDNKIPITDINVDEFNLVPYMRKDGSGKVVRGSHTLKISPNDLARLEIQLILTVFIKSRLGGKY